eukprot:g5310.t1
MAASGFGLGERGADSRGGTGASTKTVEAWTLAVSKDDKLLASGTQKGSVNLWALDGHKKQEILHQKLEGHAKSIRSLCFSADGSLLFTASDDMRVNVYDPEEVLEKEEDVQLEELGSGGHGASDLLLLSGRAGNGMVMSDALRVNVGGKLLTNYLREVVSYRQWHMMDEFEARPDVVLF